MKIKFKQVQTVLSLSFLRLLLSLGFFWVSLQSHCRLCLEFSSELLAFPSLVSLLVLISVSAASRSGLKSDPRHEVVSSPAFIIRKQRASLRTSFLLRALRAAARSVSGSSLTELASSPAIHRSSALVCSWSESQELQFLAAHPVS